MPYRDRPQIEGLCSHCRAVPPREGFKQCQRCFDYIKKWRTDNADKVNQQRATFKKKHPTYQQDRRSAIRQRTFEAYGGVCLCCKETRPVFLSIDHIDGIKHESYIKKLRGSALYEWLEREQYPSGYRVLCHNCNWAVRFGPCPHTL